jgi:protein phosphatase
LTRDQTVAQDLADTGVLNPADVSRSPLSHVLSSAIGAELRPVVTSVRLNPRVTTFLCTDGLTKHLSEDHIRDRLMTVASSEKACRVLVDDALEAGGSDNITVVCVRVRGAEQP